MDDHDGMSQASLPMFLHHYPSVQEQQRAFISAVASNARTALPIPHHDDLLTCAAINAIPNPAGLLAEFLSPADLRTRLLHLQAAAASAAAAPAPDILPPLPPYFQSCWAAAAPPQQASAAAPPLPSRLLAELALSQPAPALWAAWPAPLACAPPAPAGAAPRAGQCTPAGAQF
jgi:hypothetical protein